MDQVHKQAEFKVDSACNLGDDDDDDDDDDDTNYLSLDDMRLAHVSDAEQQIQLTVTRTDDRALTEQ